MPEDLKSIIIDGFDHMKKKDFLDIDNEDFALRFDVWGPTFRLSWIKNKSGKYRGTDIWKTLLDVIKKKFGLKDITASAEKGYDSVDKVELNGYYTMLRWGFIPDKGIKMFNALLGEDYKSLEEAFSDEKFWSDWLKYGQSWTGVFDASPNSLSWKLLYKKPI